ATSRSAPPGSQSPSPRLQLSGSPAGSSGPRSQDRPTAATPRSDSPHNSRVPLELTREVIPSRILVPGEDGYEERQGRLEVRIDPLTGHSARLISTSKLMAASDFDLEAF